MKLAFIPILLLPALVSAQVQVAPPQTREVDVYASDAGFVAAPDPSGEVAADGGVETLSPPSLAVPSPAEYPASLAGTGISGTVKLELQISDQGTVDEVSVAESVHPELDAAATAAARGLRFHPATIGDRAVPVRIHFDYVFAPPPPPKVALATLKGQVREMGTKVPIVGATVLPEGTDLAVETDTHGRFTVEVPPGTRWFRIVAPAHKSGAFRETLAEAQSVELVYALQPLTVNPYQTTIRDSRDRTEVSRISLRSQEVHEVPGTMGDPFRVVMLMPGVASVASGISYPVVRGGQPASTGYYLDGVRVPMLYHMLLGPAVVHPDLIDGIDFYPGVTPARYGRLLGGAVEGQVTKPKDDRVHASAYADLINAGAFVDVPIAETGTNVTLSGRYSYTPWLIALGANLFTTPGPDGFRRNAVANFWDYQGRIEQKAGGGTLRLLAFGSSDVFGFDDDNPEAVDAYLTSKFHRVDLRYRHPLGIGTADIGVTLGTERVGLEGKRKDESVGTFLLGSNNVAARASWSARLSDSLTVAAGADVDHRRATTTVDSTFDVPTQLGPGEATSIQAPLTLATMSGVWAEAQWRPVPQLLLVPGARVDDYHLVPGIDHLAFDPRLTARYTVSDALTLKAGVAMLHQPPTVMINLPVMDVAGLRYGLQSALTSDLGAEWKFSEGLELNADLYYTRLFRAVEFDLQGVLQDRRRRGISLADPGQQGYAYGFELMARHPLGDRWFGWVSYSFQQSKRLVTFSRYDDDEQIIGRDTKWVSFAFEQQHVFNAALSYRFPFNLSVGGVVHFNTGRPESGDISSFTHRVGTDVHTGEDRWVFADRDQVEPLPPFYRVDVRVSYTRAFQDVIAEGYLDIQNVTGNQEVIAYHYWKGPDPSPDYAPPGPAKMQREGVKIPIILPILGVKVTY